MNALKKHFYFLVIICSFFISCKKEKDTQPPVIVISSPLENQPYHVNDEVAIKGSVTDETILTTATIRLLNEQGNPVMATAVIPVSGSVAEINLRYALTDIHLESGRYQLCIFASDGRNDNIAYRWIYIHGIPRILKKIMVTTSASTQTNLSVIDSTTAVLTPYQSFSGDHLASAVNSYSQKFFHCGEYNGHFIGLDLSNMSIFLEIPVGSSPPAPYFTGFCFAANACYVGFYNEQIKGYDHSGSIIYNAKLSAGYYPRKLSMNNGQLVSAEMHKITGDKKLVCYYATGAAKQSVTLTQDVCSFCEKDQTQVFLFGNKSGQGVIQLYDRTNNNLWEPYPYPLAAGSIRCALKLDNDTYLIAHSNGTIYKYMYSTSSMTPFLSGYTALQLIREEISNTLYVIEKNEIRRFEYPGLKPLTSIHSAEEILEVSLLYNR